jgi:hypothetical protein
MSASQRGAGIGAAGVGGAPTVAMHNESNLLESGCSETKNAAPMGKASRHNIPPTDVREAVSGVVVCGWLPAGEWHPHTNPRQAHSHCFEDSLPLTLPLPRGMRIQTTRWGNSRAQESSSCRTPPKQKTSTNFQVCIYHGSGPKACRDGLQRYTS